MDPQSQNAYAYARNNPIKYIDPDGEFKVNFGNVLDIAEKVVRTAGDIVTLGTYSKTLDRVGNSGDNFAAQPSLKNGVAMVGEVALGTAINGVSAATNGMMAGQAVAAVGTARALSAVVVAEGVATTSRGAALKPAISVTEHAVERMAERGISEKMVITTLRKGAQYYDPKNQAVNHVLKNGFASGRDLLVGRNPLTNQVKTVIRGKNLVNKRFIRLK